MTAPTLLALLQDVPSARDDLPLWVHAFKAVLVFAILLVGTALLIWIERRVLARMQSRLGPNRAGPAGILQTLADGVKLFFKEDIRPTAVDGFVYTLAPILSAVVAFMAFAIVPFGGEVTVFGETFTLQLADLNIGVLWFLAMGSIHVYGIVLAGWASGSIYPLLGGVRATAQMISYELAQGLAVASVFVYAGSLRVSDIVAAQAGSGLLNGVPNWFVIPLFPAFLIFAAAVVAEVGRPPYDLAEAEGELVAGFHTEYSGIKFAMFFLAEFMNVITVSAIGATLFLGGPSGPILFHWRPIAWVWPVLWFALKTFTLVFAFVLLRATLPRVRYDRLMRFGWRWLLPLGLLWVLATAFMVMASTRFDVSSRTDVLVGVIVVAAIVYAAAPLFSRRPQPPPAQAEDDGDHET
ncbi:MAG: NADH-quinone oxidoreductase subunit NuoH, partial [Actinobacteria bacterium]|nr:NADH-quinone oxidoreductase subunit NuoH [Actinomycetota bacterium]